MPVVVVESPAKAKTINKYLGSDYTVLASYGHVRDLPPKDGSVDPDLAWLRHDVGGRLRQQAKHVKAIADALKDDPDLILATDPDREGEAISWHLKEALEKRRAIKKDTPVSRVVFNAITKDRRDPGDGRPARCRHGTGRGLSRPPRARLPRRLQPVAGALAQAAGREIGGPRAVGRAAAHRRARDGDRGVPPREYWSVTADLDTPRGQSFEARLVSLAGKKLDRYDIPTEAEAGMAVKAVRPARCRSHGGGQARHAQPLAALHDLDPAAGGQPQVRLRRAADHERGAAALRGRAHHLYADRRDRHGARGRDRRARRHHGARYGAAYVPEKPRIYKNKAKNAQEAHECIRPTDMGRDAGALKLSEAISASSTT
jgi:DNA topoisomerase-1